jgi:hypothetical protein
MNTNKKNMSEIGVTLAIGRSPGHRGSPQVTVRNAPARHRVRH